MPVSEELTPSLIKEILIDLGKATEDAPPEVKGAILVLSAQHDNLFGGVFGSHSQYFRSDVRNHAALTLWGWLDQRLGVKRPQPKSTESGGV